MNADVLTTARFDNMIDFHAHQRSIITVFAREFNTQVPYGVFETDGARLISVKEKPIHRHLINTGIYMLSPQVFKYIRNDEPLDMPTLIDKILKDDGNIAVYSSDEYWVDIGNIKDLDRARAEYRSIFGD
jgi:NDP-sugar pyrophosphorylase family protein